MLELALYLCAAAVVYTYIGYPLLIALWSKIRPRPVQRAAIQPSVAMIVVAHNEEARIAAKLKSCLAQDYPFDRLRVMVVLDGSADGTEAVVESFGDERIQLLAFPNRRGKAACLNDAAAACQEEILVFTDARQALNPQAVRCLVENFADLAVGAVSGELEFLPDDMSAFAKGVGAYWQYEKFIRRSEAAVHSVPGVTGALYAIRRACFQPIHSKTILDDVAIPMQAVRSGHRVVFESRAIAYDKASQTPAQEKVRKVRTLAGNYQFVLMYPWVLLPIVNPIFLQYCSHKLMRLVVPFAMLGLLVTNLLLVGSSPYFTALFFAQIAFYALALAATIRPARFRWRLARLASTFLILNWYAVLGLVRFLGDREGHLWHSPSGAGGKQLSQ